MATLLSESERAAALNDCIRSLVAVRQQIRAGGNLARSLMAQGQTAADIETIMNANLDTLNDSFSSVGTALGDISLIYAPVVKVGMPAGYTSAIVDAVNLANGGYATIQPNDSTTSPFYAIRAGDTITISRAENAANNGDIAVLYNPELVGADVIANGTFASDTLWTKGAGWSIAAGVASCTTTSTTIKQAKADMTTPWTNGRNYLVTYTVTRSAGSLRVGTNTQPYYRDVAASGTYTCIVPADNHADGLVFTGVGFTGTLDAVSAIPWTGLALANVLATDNAADTSITITVKGR